MTDAHDPPPGQASQWLRTYFGETIQGRPLAEIGIDPEFVRIVDAEGNERPFDGLVIFEGEALLDALQRKAFKENITIWWKPPVSKVLHGSL